jgi:glutaredoxin
MYKVYTLPNCTYCEQAKSLLQLKQLPYETYQIGVDIDREHILSQAPGIRTAPIIFENDTLIGTYHDLKTLLE